MTTPLTHRRRRSTLILGTGLSALLVLTGCAGGAAEPTASPEIPFGDETPQAAGAQESATWMLTGEPATFDTDVDSGSPENTVLSNVCERLMEVQPDLTVEPRIASSAEWTDDTTVLLTIRQDATFHDGSPVSTEDVLWSMQRHAAEGADESDEYGNVVSMAVTAPDQITVTMAQRDAIFIQAMAGNGGIIWNPRVIEAEGDNFGQPSSPDACSGPYELGTWTPGDSVTIVKHADYWDADRAGLTDEITFRWAGDDTAVVNSLTSGEVHGAYFDGPSGVVALDGAANVNLYQGPATNVWNLITTDRGAMKDERIRQALSLALNRQGVSDAAFSGLAQPWKTPVGAGAWGYEKDEFQAAYDSLTGSPAVPSDDDLAAAKALVAEAGAPTEPIIIASSGSAVRNVISNAILSAAQSIGLEAEIVTVPASQYGDFYSDEALRSTADLWSDEYYISKNDPVGFYKNGASDASVNYVGFSDPDYDALVKQAQAATDDAERAGIAIDLQQRWSDASVWIPVVQSPATLAISSSLTGVPSSSAYLYYPWASALGSAGE